jgi:hypothetical protein
MSASADIARTVPRRVALYAIATLVGLLMAAALVLWLQLGTAVFFEVIAAGIAYCF